MKSTSCFLRTLCLCAISLISVEAQQKPEATQAPPKSPPIKEAKIGESIKLESWPELVITKDSMEQWLPKSSDIIERIYGPIKGNLEVFTLKFSENPQQIIFFLDAKPEESFVSLAVGNQKFIPFSVVAHGTEGRAFSDVADDIRLGTRGRRMYIEKSASLSFLFDVPSGLVKEKRQLYLWLAVGGRDYKLFIDPGN